MNKKFRLPAILLFVVLAASAGYFFFSRNLSANPPSIELLHPTTAQQLSSGEGFMLVAEAKSDVGLNRIVLLIDGEQSQEMRFESPNETLALARFPWIGSQLGKHQLSVVAFDVTGQSSEFAVIDVEVAGIVSPIGEAYREQVLAESGEIDLETFYNDEIEEDLGADPSDLEAIAAAENPDAGAEDPGAADENQDGAANNEDGANGDAAANEQADPNQGDQNLIDQPPTLSATENIVRQGNGGVMNITLMAEDDIALDFLAVTFINIDAGEGEEFIISCQLQLQCEYPFPMPIAQEHFFLAVRAVDSAGQYSEALSWDTEALGDPAALIIVEVVIDLEEELVFNQLGALTLASGFTLAEIDFDVLRGAIDQERNMEIMAMRPGSFLINGCLIVQPPGFFNGTHIFTDCPRWDLSGEDLSGLNLTGANFSGTHFRGADISTSNLTTANLSGADISDADISLTILANANLSASSLRNSDLRGSDLRGANLEYAALHNALNVDTAFIAGKWRLVWEIVTNGFHGDIATLELLYTGDVSGGERYDLRNANLREAQLSAAILDNVDFRGSDFRGASMAAAEFHLSWLQGSFLSNANLSNVTFWRSILTDADLSNANLRFARLLCSDFTRTNFYRANLNETEVSGSVFRNAFMVSANLKIYDAGDSCGGETNFDGADLRYSNFDRQGGKNMIMTNVDFSWANVAYESFDGFNLAGSNFSQLFTKDVDFSGANLVGAIFNDTTFISPIFFDSQLMNSDFSGATLLSPRFDRANLLGATGFQDATLELPDPDNARLAPAWNATICPDGINSDNAENSSCEGHLIP